MANRIRKNELKIYLSDDEQYILDQKVKISNIRSKSSFIRQLILYGFVYDVDYSDLHEYNATLSKIRQKSTLKRCITLKSYLHSDTPFYIACFFSSQNFVLTYSLVDHVNTV